MALWGLVWVVGGALGPAVTTIWDDWYHNEFTDWHKLERTSALMAAMAAAAYWRKIRAWFLAPPGTELMQKTVTVSSGGGVPTSVAVKTETVSVEPKP